MRINTPLQSSNRGRRAVQYCMQSLTRTLCLLGALALLPTALQARTPIVPVSRWQAESTALKQVRGGSILTGTLERDNGQLAWQFDVAIPGSRNIREIRIDARTGAVVSSTLEAPTDR